MESQTYRDRIHSQLAGMSGTGTTEGTVTGGSFEYTEADMTRIRDNWLDLADSYRKCVDNSDTMSRIDPPAEDTASTFHTQAANRSGNSHRDRLEHNWRYCRQQAQLRHDALADYLGAEHSSVDDFTKAGRDGPQDEV